MTKVSRLYLHNIFKIKRNSSKNSKKILKIPKRVLKAIKKTLIIILKSLLFNALILHYLFLFNARLLAENTTELLINHNLQDKTDKIHCHTVLI